MEEKKMNEKESLEVISQMISFTKKRMEKGNGMPFLVWGYVTVFVSLLIWYLLKETNNPQMNLFWLLIPVLGYPTMILLMRNKPRGATTYIDRVISYVWIVFGVAAMLVGVTAGFVNLPILFFISFMMSMGTAITSLVIEYKPLIIVAFTSMVAALGLLWITNLNQILVFAWIFLILMVVPGHFLQFKNSKNNV